MYIRYFNFGKSLLYYFEILILDITGDERIIKIIVCDSI
jgi:hypothetical protein